MKLIVSDLDGTLCARKGKSIGKREAAVINSVSESNCFAVATGRSYPEVKKMLLEIKNYISVCCDGALAVCGEKTVFEKPFPEEKLQIFKECTDVVLYGKYMMYVKGTSGFIRKCRKQFYSHVTSFEDISEIDASIYKAVVYKQNNPGFICAELKKIYDSFELAEYVMPDADKYYAVMSIIESLGITRDECIVFGDGENDVLMLKEFKNSYAVSWAKPSVKACARFISKDVVLTVKELFVEDKL